MKRFISIVFTLVVTLCVLCSTACSSAPTLNSLGVIYKNQLITQAQINAGTQDGLFQVVVLDAEKTKENIQNYIFTPGIEEDDIVAGLFVEYVVLDLEDNPLYTIYYNFGLQFNKAQSSSVEVSYIGWWDTWTLEVVTGNPTILFEY